MAKNLDLILGKDSFKTISESENGDNSLMIVEEENCLTLNDGENCKKGYIQFYQDVDGFGYQFTFLDYAESHCPGEGNFSILFNKLEFIARKKKSEYILLMVDSDNDDAISIYEYLGFYSLGDMDLISENIDRIFMRKDLLFDCE